ncbi:hypothetical protein FQR65_LT05964 [Abscondita terminalis]|nr:hypothetical protein FQR65_LT05964 [Abscondita terminalis]
MKLLVVLSLICAAFAAVPHRNVLTVREALKSSSSKIISGQPAAEGQFPWQVLNQFKIPAGTATCGGALIKPRWVLTAAHCAQDAYHFTITLGSLRSDGALEPHAKVVETEKGIVHPNYDPYYLRNDLALVDLQVEVALSNYIQPIPLGTENVADGVSLTVSGWGKTSDGPVGVSRVLNFVELTTISNQQCRDVYGTTVTDGTLCCKGAPQHSTCNGDSGGPLVQIIGGTAYHTGVVSFVHVNGCASGNPSGYARTSYYNGWIESTSA